MQRIVAQLQEADSVAFSVVSHRYAKKQPAVTVDLIVEIEGKPLGACKGIKYNTVLSLRSRPGAELRLLH